MSFYCLVTGVLTSAPQQVARSATKRRPYYRGSLVIEAESGQWRPARFATWSSTVADELGGLDKGDAVAIAGRMSLGAYSHEGEPRTAINIQIDRLLSLPRPARARRSLDEHDPAIENEPEAEADARADTAALGASRSPGGEARELERRSGSSP
jgi:single-stranded DNA-binding protein